MSITSGAEGAKTDLRLSDHPDPSPNDAARLVAELIEFRQAGQRERERQILRTLRNQHGLRIGFASKLKGGLR